MGVLRIRIVECVFPKVFPEVTNGNYPPSRLFPQPVVRNRFYGGFSGRRSRLSTPHSTFELGHTDRGPYAVFGDVSAFCTDVFTKNVRSPAHTESLLPTTSR